MSAEGVIELMRTAGIVQEGDPRLAQVARHFALPEERVDAEATLTALRNAAERVGAVHDFAKGLGVAAPQIAIDRAAAIVRMPSGESVSLLNPVVVEESAETDEQFEGCLSFSMFVGLFRDRSGFGSATNLWKASSRFPPSSTQLPGWSRISSIIWRECCTGKGCVRARGRFLCPSTGDHVLRDGIRGRYSSTEGLMLAVPWDTLADFGIHASRVSSVNNWAIYFLRGGVRAGGVDCSHPELPGGFEVVGDVDEDALLGVYVEVGREMGWCSWAMLDLDPLVTESTRRLAVAAEATS